MKTHQEQELLSAFVDGELTEREQVTVEAHLASCADCRSVLHALRATLTDLASLPETVPSQRDSWALRSAISKERRLDRRARRWYLVSGGAAAAVVAVLAFALSTGGGGGVAGLGSEGVRARGLGLNFASVNYTESSAREVLLRFSSSVPEARAATESGGSFDSTYGPGTGGGNTGAQSPAAGELSTSTYSMAEEDARAAGNRLSQCVQTVTGSTDQPLEPRYYEAASFDGEPAFLLVFENPTAKRLELWVVRRSDCVTKFFAQTRA